MEYKTNNYSIEISSFNYNLLNYREMYSQNSFAQQMYQNLIKYIPNTTRTGEYIKSN